MQVFMFSSTQLLRLNVEAGMTLFLAESLVRPEATKQELAEATQLFAKAAFTAVREATTNAVKAIFYGLAILPLALGSLCGGASWYREAKQRFSNCSNKAVATTLMLPVAVTSYFKPSYAGAVREKQAVKFAQQVENYRQRTTQELAKRIELLNKANLKNSPEDQPIVGQMIARFEQVVKGELRVLDAEQNYFDGFNLAVQDINVWMKLVAAKKDNSQLLLARANPEDSKLLRVRGNARALNCYGVSLGTANDPECVSYYEKAIEKGSLHAVGNLAGNYCYGPQGIQDSKKGFKLAQRADDAGSVQWSIIPILGEAYEKGELVRKNAFKAALHYHVGAARGQTDCQIALAKLYEAGVGVKQNSRLAFSWTLKAAQGGDKNSAQVIAHAYERGNDYVGVNKVKALAWYRKSGDGQDVRAKIKKLKKELAPPTTKPVVAKSRWRIFG